jgi:hypothetical protein
MLNLINVARPLIDEFYADLEGSNANLKNQSGS